MIETQDFFNFLSKWEHSPIEKKILPTFIFMNFPINLVKKINTTEFYLK